MICSQRTYLISSLLAIVFLLASGCTSRENTPGSNTESAGGFSTAGGSGTEARRAMTLPEWFDCLRESGGLTIAAHRGGPSPGFPENALETIKHNFERGLTTFELDVAESSDGILYLMHDGTLNRTTTGTGSVAQTEWASVSILRLVDNEGRPTRFAPPKLNQVLEWAKSTGALIEIDRKASASFAGIVRAVRDVGAEDVVVLITYSDQEARRVAELAPDLMLTAGANSDAEAERLVAAGVDRKNMIVWTGTRSPGPRLWRSLARNGIEAGFGTLGRPGTRLDDRYAEDGDLSEYQALAESGLVLLSTDTPLAAAEALEADDVGMTMCGR